VTGVTVPWCQKCRSKHSPPASGPFKAASAALALGGAHRAFDRTFAAVGQEAAQTTGKFDLPIEQLTKVNVPAGTPRGTITLPLFKGAVRTPSA
jgi:hypothetical protein